FAQKTTPRCPASAKIDTTLTARLGCCTGAQRQPMFLQGFGVCKNARAHCALADVAKLTQKVQPTLKNRAFGVPSVATALQPSEISYKIARRSAELFQTALEATRLHTDRIFIVLMLLQWVAGMLAAVWISPRAWSGTTSETHVHVWTAIVLGG